jgi:hypothetical protein
MNIRKIIQRRIRSSGGGVNAVGDVDAAISANIGKSGGSSHLSTRSRKRVVQRSGRTQVSEAFETQEGTGDRGRKR